MVIFTKFYSHLITRERLFFISSPFPLPKIFSSLAGINITCTDALPKNLFAEFAATKFSMSPADIARIFKFVPSLGRVETLENVEQFVRTLNNSGCNKDEITKIMRTQPSLLTMSAERVVEPKIKLLKDLGIEGENLGKLLSITPRIMGVSLNNDLLPKMAFLRSVFQSQGLVIKAILRFPQLLSYNLDKTLKPSVAFWEGYCFCGTELAKFIYLNPRVLACTSLTSAQVDLIHKIGVGKGSKMFKYVLITVATGRIETLEAKVQNFQLCGLSAEETWQLFRSCPAVFGFSKEKVREKMIFLVNEMELSVNFVVKRPWMLTMSIEKLIIPRLLVLQNMKSKNGVGFLKPHQVISFLRMSEVKFVKEIIKRHPESTVLWTIYKNAIASVLSRTMISRKDGSL